MKSAVVLLAFFATACVAESVPVPTPTDGDDGAGEGKVILSLCPDLKVAYPGFREKIDLKSILGPWHMIRNNCPDGPDPTKMDVDCMREMYYIDDKTPKNSANWIMQMRNRTTMDYQTCTGVMTFTEQDGDGKIDNLFEFDFTEPSANMTTKGQMALIDSDNGESWALWAICMEMGPTMKHVGWTIYSRTPWVDARLEQNLVEKIEKYGGIAPKDLKGIGQTDCFKKPVQ